MSQQGASAALDVSPDGTFGTKIASPHFEVIIERRGGLDIAAAKNLHDAEEARGDRVDRRGHDLSNSGEYNRRHHAVLRKGRDMVSAVAIGQVILGDKAEKEKTDILNTGCAVDLAELEGDDLTGGDVSYEFKVPSPTVKTFSKGKGSKEKGGQPASVGHLYGFGNTEEKYRVKILGCRRRGRPRDKFDHTTGKGYVQERRGDYYDALVVKKGRVIPMIIEVVRRHHSSRACAHRASRSAC